MAWAKNGSTTTSASTTLQVADLTTSKTNMLMGHMLSVGVDSFRGIRFNGDTSSNYAVRSNDSGSSEGSSVNLSYGIMDQGGSWGSNDHGFFIFYVCSVVGKEKLYIEFAMGSVASGAGTAPRRREYAGKHTNTSALSQIDIVAYSGTGWGADSNLSVLGSDLTPASATTIETGSIYIDTDINNRYWFDGTNWNIQPSTFEDDFSSNSNWTQVGSAITVTGGVAQGSSVPANAEHRIYKDTGAATSDTKLVMDWKFRMTSMPNGDSFFQIMFSSNTNFGASSGDAVGVQIANESPSNIIRTRSFEIVSGTKSNSGSYGTTLSTNTDYYPRLTLDGTSLTLEVFSDSARTTQVGSDYVKTVTGVTGLKYIQISSTNYGISTASSFTIDDVVIYKEVTSV